MKIYCGEHLLVPDQSFILPPLSSYHGFKMTCPAKPKVHQHCYPSTVSTLNWSGASNPSWNCRYQPRNPQSQKSSQPKYYQQWQQGMWTPEQWRLLSLSCVTSPPSQSRLRDIGRVLQNCLLKLVPVPGPVQVGQHRWRAAALYCPHHPVADKLKLP